MACFSDVGVMIYLKKSLAFMSFCLFCLTSVNSYAINCNAQLKRVESMVCSESLLMRLDGEMNNNYKFMINSNIGIGAVADLRRTQKKWVLERNRCKSQKCVIDLYRSRLDEICDYPVINGVHPVCTSYDQIVDKADN